MELTQLMRLDDFSGLLGGVDRTTIDRWTKTCDFPRPIVLGAKKKFWIRKEIEAWLDTRRT